MNRLNDLAQRPVGRLLWNYCLPAVVGMVVMSLYHVIDRMFIGRGVGPEAISGLAITFPVMNLSAALGTLIGAGAAARTSIALGAGDRRGANLILGNALTMTLIIGIIYIGLFAFFLTDILRAFGASDATLPYAYDFMYYMLPGLMVTNLCYSFNNVQRASGYPIRAMVAMIIGAGLNTILAPIFIFGLDMGIKGAAIATDIAMFVSAAFVLGHFMLKDSTVHFTHGTFRPRLHIIWQIISIGASPALINAAACCINIFINRSLLHYGSDMAVGAAGIFTTYTQLIVTIIVGTGLGMQPIIGYNYGAGHLHRLRRTYTLAVTFSTAVCTAGCILGLLFPRHIALIFTDNEELLATTANAFSHALPAFWVVGFQIISTSFMQSIGQAGKSIILSLSRQVLFLIPLMAIMSRIRGLNGVWESFPLSDLLATIVTAALVIIQMRKINHQTPIPQHSK